MGKSPTGRYLLNTNICIYIAEGQPLAVRARFDQHTLHDLAMSTITLGELRFGAAKSQACAEGWILVSNNTREFERVPGLQLENWVE